VPTLLDTNLSDQSRAEREFRDGIQAISFEIREMELGLQAAQNTAVKQREVVALQNVITVHTAEDLFARFVESCPPYASPPCS